MADLKIYRMLRVLEYVGPAEWIHHTLDRREVKGTRIIDGDKLIREGIIGESPEEVCGVEEIFQVAALVEENIQLKAQNEKFRQWAIVNGFNPEVIIR